MIYKNIIVFSVLFLILNIQSLATNLTFENRFSDSSIVTKAKQLKELYIDIAIANEKDSLKKIFFKLFPSTFSEFILLYGTGSKNPYDGNEEINPGPLYSESFKHITVLEQIKMDEKIYVKKIIGIATNGHWDSDGVNFFQEMLIKKSIAQKEVVFDILAKEKDKNLKSFWFFYFDGPHPMKEYPDEFNSLESKYKKVFDAMKSAWLESQKNKHH